MTKRKIINGAVLCAAAVLWIGGVAAATGGTTPANLSWQAASELTPRGGSRGRIVALNQDTSRVSGDFKEGEVVVSSVVATGICGVVSRQTTIRNVSDHPVTVKNALDRWTFADGDWEVYTQSSEWQKESVLVDTPELTVLQYSDAARTDVRLVFVPSGLTASATVFPPVDANLTYGVRGKPRTGSDLIRTGIPMNGGCQVLSLAQTLN